MEFRVEELRDDEADLGFDDDHLDKDRAYHTGLLPPAGGHSASSQILRLSARYRSLVALSVHMRALCPSTCPVLHLQMDFERAVFRAIPSSSSPIIWELLGQRRKVTLMALRLSSLQALMVLYDAYLERVLPPHLIVDIHLHPAFVRDVGSALPTDLSPLVPGSVEAFLAEYQSGLMARKLGDRLQWYGRMYEHILRWYFPHTLLPILKKASWQSIAILLADHRFPQTHNQCYPMYTLCKFAVLIIKDIALMHDDHDLLFDANCLLRSTIKNAHLVAQQSRPTSPYSQSPFPSHHPPSPTLPESCTMNEEPVLFEVMQEYPLSMALSEGQQAGDRLAIALTKEHGSAEAPLAISFALESTTGTLIVILTSFANPTVSRRIRHRLGQLKAFLTGHVSMLHQLSCCDLGGRSTANPIMSWEALLQTLRTILFDS